MTRLTAHVVRGATAAALIAWALLFSQSEPALAVVAGVAAAIAMRGCPACWMLGLLDAISETTRIRRAGPGRRSQGLGRNTASPAGPETSRAGLHALCTIERTHGLPE